jgi:hypothetical protein
MTQVSAKGLSEKLALRYFVNAKRFSRNLSLLDLCITDSSH